MYVPFRQERRKTRKLNYMPTIFYSLLNRIFLLRSRSKLSFHFSFRHRPPEQEEGKEGKNVFHHNEKYLKVFFIFHSITGREQQKKQFNQS